jgi:glycine dehydrogenase
MASFYMQWHGAPGLKKIALKTRFMSQIFMEELEKVGIKFATDRENYFDTVCIKVEESGFTSSDFLLAQFHKYGINIRKVDNNHVSVSFDEISSLYNLDELIEIFYSLKKNKTMGSTETQIGFEHYSDRIYNQVPKELRRRTKFMQQNQFKMKFSETNMMRYIQRLADKDLSLTNSMIPLGSCTMKLNSAICMIPVTWDGFANLHPYVPIDQA